MANMNWDQMREEAEKNGGFAPHPIGTFRFKVTEASLKKGSTGNGQILTRLENQEAGPLNGKNVLNNMSPLKNDGTPNGMFFQQLGALGFQNDSPLFAQLSNMSEEQGLAYIATNLLGKEAVCEITHREWGGATRDNVKSMKPVGAAAATGGVPAAAPAPVVASAGLPPVPAAPVAVAPAPVVAAPAPAVIPVAPAPVAAPVPQAVVEPEPVVPVPVAPAPVPVAAVEATPAPETVEQVVAQTPQPAQPLPTPPTRPF